MTTFFSQVSIFNQGNLNKVLGLKQNIYLNIKNISNKIWDIYQGDLEYYKGKLEYFKGELEYVKKRFRIF